MIHTQPAQELECTPPETLSPPSGGDPVCTASHKEDPTPIVTQENPVGRVLLCYTGGTLGMVKQAGSWSPQQARGGLAALIASMIEFHDDTMPDIYMVEYDPLLDSSNIGPKNWCSLANLVGRHYFDYDGFVIIHGTDTMAYTASALSFMLEGLGKTVVLTGSQIPLSRVRNDAVENLLGALMIAGHYTIPEVAVFFNGRLFRGNRCTKTDASGLDDGSRAEYLEPLPG